MAAKTLGWLVLLAGLAGLPGCCSIATVLCGIEAPEAPSELTRDTADGAIDFIVDAFHDRRIRDLYESMHPDFVKAHGDFSLSEFTAGYDRFEDRFKLYAAQLAAGQRSDPFVDDDGAHYFRLVTPESQVIVGFKNQPAYRIYLNDEDLPEIPGYLPDLGTALETDGENLWVRAPLSLQGYGVPASLVKRVEIHQDWLLHHLQGDETLAKVLRGEYEGSSQ